ncbi:hypothetical protein LCGC14_1385320 [marine sediment metagenome]|uniref:Uncharacterized protein n=1 Tax=marine sediment metagenome TaxID=412755 RepID=A0A0F9MGY2_9ZZZZ
MVLVRRKKKGTKFGTLQKSGRVTNVRTINLNRIKSSDPLAFAFGKFKGETTGTPIPRDKDLAPEFKRGFGEGRAIRIRRRKKK